MGGKVTLVIKNGAPEEIRTPDPQIRSLVLYPAELRARFAGANLCRGRLEGKRQGKSLWSTCNRPLYRGNLVPETASPLLSTARVLVKTDGWSLMACHEHRAKVGFRRVGPH